MKTLDAYILRQLVAVTLLGVLSLTLLLLLGQLFKELHSLLVESGAPPSIVIDFILQVIPFSLTFSVPWGFLTAVLLVYGRLAADNELTSMRMAGLSLWRLSMPAIGLAVVLSGLCYYINIEIAPRGKNAMSELAMRAAMDNPRNLLCSGQGVTKLDKVRLYVESRDGDTLLGMHIYPDETAEKEGASFEAMHARSAEIGHFDTKRRILDMEMYNVTIEHRSGGHVVSLPQIDRMPMSIHIPLKSRRKMKPNRFTNSEIADTIAHLERVSPLTSKEMHRYTEAARAAQPFPCAALLMEEATKEAEYLIRQMPKKVEAAFRTEGVQRASFACACLVFSLIGVPLAITARRRDTSTGFALGILVAAVYFLALVFCELSRKSSGIAPYIILWIPNVLCLLFALWQHRKALYRG